MSLYFYTKKECPLCDKGLVQLEILQQEKNFNIIIRDIYTDDEWLEKYQIRIPVVETKEGAVLDEGVLSFELLSSNYEKYISK
ncbi:glutaredoxin family protein [Salipaludibacillus sp. CF4.18]|uniref:glutaredoxin family protein n=1 Tax=Salipaludibacillus sp. CF4.18 TaxID=3373081 RepID=UPI003EE7E8D5